MVELVRHDLEFILRQIKIAEAHAAGTPLTEIRVDANGNVTNDPLAALAISTRCCRSACAPWPAASTTWRTDASYGVPRTSPSSAC
jgi:hypothetical protein